MLWPHLSASSQVYSKRGWTEEDICPQASVSGGSTKMLAFFNSNREVAASRERLNPLRWPRVAFTLEWPPPHLFLALISLLLFYYC